MTSGSTRSPSRGGLGAKWETLQRPYSFMFSEDFQKDLDAELARGFDVFRATWNNSGAAGRASGTPTGRC